MQPSTSTSAGRPTGPDHASVADEHRRDITSNSSGVHTAIPLPSHLTCALGWMPRRHKAAAKFSTGQQRKTVSGLRPRPSSRFTRRTRSFSNHEVTPASPWPWFARHAVTGAPPCLTTMSSERRMLLRAYGAEPGPPGCGRHVRCHRHKLVSWPRPINATVPQQPENPANSGHPSRSPLRGLADGKVDIVVAGSRTGGTSPAPRRSSRNALPAWSP